MNGWGVDAGLEFYTTNEDGRARLLPAFDFHGDHDNVACVDGRKTAKLQEHQRHEGHRCRPSQVTPSRFWAAKGRCELTAEWTCSLLRHRDLSER